jgi:hypothetical protein
VLIYPFAQKIYNTMKGPMTCLAIPRLSSGTYGWEIVEDLTTINFDAPRPIAVEKKASVVAALAVDAGLQADAPDVYFFGKQVLQLLYPYRERNISKLVGKVDLPNVPKRIVESLHMNVIGCPSLQNLLIIPACAIGFSSGIDNDKSHNMPGLETV